MGFLTGHGTLRGRLGKFGLKDNTTCRYCMEGEEAPHHLLTNYEPIAIKRANTLREYQLEAEHLPYLILLQTIQFMVAIGLER